MSIHLYEIILFLFDIPLTDAFAVHAVQQVAVPALDTVASGFAVGADAAAVAGNKPRYLKGDTLLGDGIYNFSLYNCMTIHKHYLSIVEFNLKYMIFV